MIINKNNTKHYQWGNNCDAWTLLESKDVIIKEEIMPPKTEEKLHYHNATEQFFYILEGMATFLLENEKICISKNEGIKIAMKQSHKISNETASKLKFLVISFPGNVKDRFDVGNDITI